MSAMTTFIALLWLGLGLGLCLNAKPNIKNLQYVAFLLFAPAVFGVKLVTLIYDKKETDNF